MEYMELHSCTAGQALATGRFPLIEKRSLQRRVAGTVKADIVSEKKPVVAERKRVVVYTEETVTEHFYGEAGLKKTLIDAGIMDPASKRNLHPERVLNRDESPQFIQYCTTKGNNILRRGAAKGKSTVMPDSENRECVTIDVVTGLDGFLYGLHVLISRECITEGCVLDEMNIFDSKIHKLSKLSTFCLLSNNQCGVQTGVSLLNREKMLVDELKQRGVQFPVVETTDNHESRYDEEVMKYCEDNGIAQWSEKSNTSGKFQMLDQVNRQFHVEYIKGAREHIKLRRAQMEAEFNRVVDESEVKLALTDFFIILSRIWFTWSIVMDRITAWRRVGVLPDRLAPELIPRDQFQTEPSQQAVVIAGPQRVEDFPASPEEGRPCSYIYQRHRAEAY
ncbi:hypothetical protein CYMTET_28846 [Cymbomonas tetramitiformis]|uniref:Uncharacterized protein n=1 Tax=Cymbomonas tetramitiformis TaxID=36881 RepID=A0AAE0FMF9_9CHLO|nr:hypothetical protein CYMTET_28846 [Cymbomonas tetramitiformis]